MFVFLKCELQVHQAAQMKLRGLLFGESLVDLGHSKNPDHTQLQRVSCDLKVVL